MNICLMASIYPFHIPRNLLNRSSGRKRGMASTPLFIIPDFFLHFPNELSYGYLRFEGNRKIPLERQGKWHLKGKARIEK
jgi:hypothetical protein